MNEVIHQPVRFSIVAALMGADELELAFLRGTVQISDSVLSRYPTQLERAGYVAARQGHVGKRPRTWLGITGAGRSAYAAHIDALRAIVGPTLGAPHRDPAPSRRVGHPPPDGKPDPIERVDSADRAG